MEKVGSTVLLIIIIVALSPTKEVVGVPKEDIITQVPINDNTKGEEDIRITNMAQTMMIILDMEEETIGIRRVETTNTSRLIKYGMMTSLRRSLI
jgi:hypothetical protein